SVGPARVRGHGREGPHRDDCSGRCPPQAQLTALAKTIPGRADEALKLSLGRAVAVCRPRFELLAVQNGDEAALGFDHPFTLQDMKALNHSWPSHTRHDREKLMGERDVAV